MRPMLAANIDLEKLNFPYFASPKIDGIRCLIYEGKALYRSLKPITNFYVRQMLEDHVHNLNGLDGELITLGTFNNITSAINAEYGMPNFTFVAFDKISYGNYHKRFLNAQLTLPPFVVKVETEPITNITELLSFETKCLQQGYEGVMLRRADGNDHYKHGRSTAKESFLLKLKRFEDAEAEIIDFIEEMENTNPQEKNELGLSERSSHLSGKNPKDTLGSLTVINKEFGVFNIGTGFTSILRKEIWNNKDTLKGKIVKFKFQRKGTLDTPRFPVFLGIRDRKDSD